MWFNPFALVMLPVIPYWMFWQYVILGDPPEVTRDDLGRPRRRR